MVLHLIVGRRLPSTVPLNKAKGGVAATERNAGGFSIEVTIYFLRSFWMSRSNEAFDSINVS